MTLQSTGVEGSTRQGAPLFHIRTFGCRVNHVESDKIAALLLQAGWEQSSMELADAVIINTCTVTGEADRKNRKCINQALKRTRGPVIVTGCSANLKAAEYEAVDPRVRVECDKEQVARLAMALQGAEVPEELECVVTYGEGFRTRSGIKVQDGCDNACTFCIVHTARGKARSADPEHILAEARQLVAAGAEELVLVGIDTGAYRWGGTDLTALIRRLLDETRVGRIRIPSIEPQSVTPQLIQLMAQEQGRLCRHLHLVMQSGSSKVLREMARHYDAGKFKALVQELRAAVPGLALSTDVIVGFPGETEEDFSATCQMVRDCGFMKLHIFPYSMRPGTPAAARRDQVSPELKAQRAATLKELGDALAAEDMRNRIGTFETVVVEEDAPGGVLGTTESFHSCVIRSQAKPLCGSLVTVKLAGIDEELGALVGTLSE